MTCSKRYLEAKKIVAKDKKYSLSEAIELIKSMPHAKFDETLEVSSKLGADPKQSDEMVRGSVILPHGTGREVRVLVFCSSDKEKDAIEAGADHIGSDDLIEKILKEGWAEFDCCIAMPSMMRTVSKLGKFLGPRGLMPSPKTGTVTDNVAHAVKEAKRGKIDFRMDKLGGVHNGIGKISFSKEKLLENVESFIQALLASKPHASKGEFIESFHLSTTMGPSLTIEL